MRVRVLPPSSNTGAENTRKNELRALVDWVRITFFTLDSVQVCTQILRMKLEDFEQVDRGRYRYRKSLKNGNIVIYYEGIDENMGVCLDMSGQGCRQFEALENFDSWQEFFKRVLREKEVNFPRIDAAVDDMKGYFKIEQIDKKIDKGEVATIFKGVEDKGKRSLKGDDKKRGKTIQFGSRESMICVRFYDKLAEMRAKGKEKKIPEGVTFWNRVEIEAKDDRARKIAELIAEGKPIGEMVKGILSRYIRFLVADPNNKNKSRWKTWRQWERFLGGVGKLILSVSPEEKTIEENIEWLEKQVSKTLLKVVMAESMEFVQNLIVKESVEQKLRPRDFQQIEAYRNKKARLLAQDETSEKTRTILTSRSVYSRR